MGESVTVMSFVKTASRLTRRRGRQSVRSNSKRSRRHRRRSVGGRSNRNRRQKPSVGSKRKCSSQLHFWKSHGNGKLFATILARPFRFQPSASFPSNPPSTF